MIHCPVSSQIWNWVNALEGVSFDISSLESLWDSCQTGDQSVRRLRIALCGTICWGIWGERSRLTFDTDSSAKPICALIAHIYALFLYWIGGMVSGPVALPKVSQVSYDDDET
jgi:hypothetical protein